MATQEKDKVSDFKRKPILDAAARLHESEVARLRKDREDLAVALGAQHAANLALRGRMAKLEAALQNSNSRCCGDCGCTPAAGEAHAPECYVAEALR